MVKKFAPSKAMFGLMMFEYLGNSPNSGNERPTPRIYTRLKHEVT